jgi:hypothetical protein
MWKRLTFKTTVNLPGVVDIPLVVDFNFHPGHAMTTDAGGISQPGEAPEVDDIHVRRFDDGGPEGEPDFFNLLPPEQRREIEKRCIEYAYSGKAGLCQN